MYINTRSADMYNVLERQMQAKLTAGLTEATPNTPDLLAQAKAMLAKFDEAIAMVTKAEPLGPWYDDVARLRTVRAHLREVNPALKAGDSAKARKSFGEFDEKWDSIEDLVKDRDVLGVQLYRRRHDEHRPRPEARDARRQQRPDACERRDGRIQQDCRAGDAGSARTLGAGQMTRRELLQAGVAVLGARVVSAQPAPRFGSVKALVFDTFGTVVDWRTSVARENEALAKRKGLTVDGAKFADAWRAGYAAEHGPRPARASCRGPISTTCIG